MYRYSRLTIFFYLYLYAVMNIDRFRCISRCCLYLNTILCFGSQPFVFPAGICFALPGGEGVWRVFPGTIRTVQEHLDPGQSCGPVMSTRAVKRCILSQTVIYKGNQRNSSHKYKCLSQVCMSYLL